MLSSHTSALILLGKSVGLSLALFGFAPVEFSSKILTSPIKGLRSVLSGLNATDNHWLLSNQRFETSPSFSSSALLNANRLGASAHAFFAQIRLRLFLWARRATHQFRSGSKVFVLAACSSQPAVHFAQFALNFVRQAKHC